MNLKFITNCKSTANFIAFRTKFCVFFPTFLHSFIIVLNSLAYIFKLQYCNIEFPLDFWHSRDKTQLISRKLPVCVVHSLSPEMTHILIILADTKPPQQIELQPPVSTPTGHRTSGNNRNETFRNQTWNKWLPLAGSNWCCQYCHAATKLLRFCRLLFDGFLLHIKLNRSSHRCLKPATQLHLVELYLHFVIRLQGVVFN
jgi:hypothetical protein